MITKDLTKKEIGENVMTNLEYIEIYPKVHVYKNILENVEDLYSVMKESEATSEGKYFLKPWDQWAHFGTYTQTKNELECDDQTKASEMYIKEKKFADQVQKAYELALKHYVEKTNTELPEDWWFSGCSFSKYNDQIDVLSNRMTMQYHTDHITSEKDMPGEKFFITCTMYINDDYDGGDIEFYVDGVLSNHKPSAGDILIFPSTEPYYHGVKTISNGQKFLVRNFVMTQFKGTEEWLSNQLKFGAFRWSKMEYDRVKHDNPRNAKYFFNGNPLEYDDFLKAKLEFQQEQM
jgi:hypothetical protein